MLDFPWKVYRRAYSGCRLRNLIVDRRRFLLALGSGLLGTRALLADDQAQPIEPSQSEAPPSFPSWQDFAAEGLVLEHWTPEQDDTWRWFRLERYEQSDWKTAAISLPIHRTSDESFEPSDGYVPTADIPSHVITGAIPELPPGLEDRMAPSQFELSDPATRTPDPDIRLRDGKPPSDWLTSLRATELREWLQTIDPIQAEVRGMTHWVHLIRDHGFDPLRINGLTEEEFTQLHSAAHEGY
jgi:hypothetical protein